MVSTAKHSVARHSTAQPDKLADDCHAQPQPRRPIGLPPGQRPSCPGLQPTMRTCRLHGGHPTPPPNTHTYSYLGRGHACRAGSTHDVQECASLQGRQTWQGISRQQHSWASRPPSHGTRRWMPLWHTRPPIPMLHTVLVFRQPHLEFRDRHVCCALQQHLDRVAAGWQQERRVSTIRQLRPPRSTRHPPHRCRPAPPNTDRQHRKNGTLTQQLTHTHTEHAATCQPSTPALPPSAACPQRACCRRR